MTYQPSGQSRRSLSRFQLHEATRNISTPPWMGLLVHCRVTPSIKFALRHSESWVSRHNVTQTISLARARTRTARSAVERTNNEATALLHKWADNKNITTHLAISHVLQRGEHILCYVTFSNSYRFLWISNNRFGHSESFDVIVLLIRKDTLCC